MRKNNSKNKIAYTICGLVASAFLSAAPQARALTVTQTGTFTGDNQVFQYSFTLPTASPILLYTTSYGGGMNVNGTTSAAGGFVPVLTLFNNAGTPVTNDGGSGMWRGFGGLDPVTKKYNDAFLSTSLAAGSYTLTLTEFPNVAAGRLSDGFLFASDPNATGSVCGSASGRFLDSTVAPCAQRTGNYTLNVNTTPEPATALLFLPAVAAAFLFRKRLSSSRT